MEEQHPAATLRGTHKLGEIVGYAWRIYLANFTALFAIALITVPLQMLQAVIARRVDSQAAQGGIDLLFFGPDLFVGVVAAGALIFAVHTVSGGARAEAMPALDAAFERVSALLATMLLEIALIFASIFAAPALAVYWLFKRDATIDGERNWWLAIVPFALTIYLAVRWGLAQQATMLEGRQAWSALDASAALVRGRWWRTLGVVLVIALITLGPSLIALASQAAHPLVEAIVTSSAAALALPFLITGQTLLYYDLKARNTVGVTTAPVDTAEPDLQG